MKLRLIGVISIVIIIFSACKKDDPSGVSISGKVKDARTGDGAPNIKITLLAQGYSDGVFNSNFQEIEESNSSNNGDYSFNFDFSNVTTYRFELEGEHYYDIFHEHNPDNLPPGADNHLDLPIDSRAWVKLIVQNQDPATAGDQITFGYNVDAANCQECCSSELFEYFGIISESQICEVFGGSFATASGVFFNPVQGLENFSDSVFCVPKDTTDFLIAF